MEIVIKRQGDYVKKSQNSKLKYNCQNIEGLSNEFKKQRFQQNNQKKNNDAGARIKSKFTQTTRSRKNTQNKQKKIYKKEDWRESRIYKMHQKEISNKAKKSETAKTKISGLNNRVRCNKNTKLTKKEQNTKAYSAPKSQQQELVKIGKP